MSLFSRRTPPPKLEQTASVPEDPRESFSFFISKLAFNDGTELDLDIDSLTVFVGPNNVGKTRTLTDITLKLLGMHGKLLSALETRKTGDHEQLRAWMNRHYIIDRRYDWYKAWGDNISVRDLNDHWAQPNALGQLTPFLCRLVSTQRRLEACQGAETIDIINEPCEHPIQALIGNKEIEKRLSASSVEAFGLPLFLDRWSGKTIALRCGKLPDSEQWTLPFLKAVQSQPHTEWQGDGIRSFVGCLLEGVLTPHPLVLIDEPEAFLHPQHARILGRMLALEKPKGRQLFIATHSLHLLLGLLDANRPAIRVVRIRRDGNLNPIRELRQDRILEVWKDTLLRTSNVLEGVFHDRVVISEGDADSRFYSCVLDAIISTRSPVQRPDVMFTSCGGKQRMPLVIRALKALDIVVSVIVDFDVLSDEKDLRDIVTALGHSWDNIRPTWRQVNAALSSVAPPLSRSQVQQSIHECLGRATGAYLQDETRKQILDCLRTASPWAAAKRGGSASIPSGEPTAAFLSLNSNLERIGIFIVDCGELERFVPSVGLHGPSWVTEVLQKDLATDPELDQARSFVRKACGLQDREGNIADNNL